LKELSKTQLLEDSLVHCGLVLDNKAKSFLSFLEEEGIITLSDPLKTELLPAEYVEQYKRQIFFLLDILRSPQKTLTVQSKIFDAQIAVFGVGAIGSIILQQLCMMGFRKFTLVDDSHVEESDLARTPYRVALQSGETKTLAAKALIEEISFKPIVHLSNTRLMSQTNIDELIRGTTLIVNTADEPYIGYTNIKLSRYALQHNIPLLAAGGFDAHLASLGELLLPHVTPCADCFATFFHESLKDWKPVPHPVKEREAWFGGLGSLSVFSASTAALEILSYFMNPEMKQIAPAERGEFLFHDYSLDTFAVAKDARCQSCGCGQK
jgi:molybdopterin/thiamine biosynthesis adenylyltransferase